MGERVYGQHAFHRLLRVVNYYWIMVYHTLGVMRPVFSRFIGVQQGPLNYTGLWLWISLTVLILNRFRFIRIRDTLMLNQQDNPEFWFARYNMMFPPSFLHNRLSAHYIEINHIFAVEMMKKYMKARKEILAEREHSGMDEKMTRYITNASYVFEGFPKDADNVKRLKDENKF